MRLYQQHLDAGVKSGIDPKVDPQGFRRAGEAGLRHIRIGPSVPQAPTQGSATPSGSASGSAQ